MFWTDKFARSPKIESAWMTGENRVTLVSARLGQPTGLAIDYQMNHRVYWCDSKENVIESMKYDGTDRAIVVRSGTNYITLHIICNNYIIMAIVENLKVTAAINNIQWGRMFLRNCIVVVL
jgi:hypothetical protein